MALWRSAVRHGSVARRHLDLLHHEVRDPVEDVVLARHVLVERHRLDAERLADATHRDGVDALLVGQLQGGPEDALAAQLLARRSRLRRGRHAISRRRVLTGLRCSRKVRSVKAYSVIQKTQGVVRCCNSSSRSPGSWSSPRCRSACSSSSACGRSRRIVQVPIIWLGKHQFNKIALRTAGTPETGTSIVRHRGRTSGRTFETPVGVLATDDGFLIALPYGLRSNWLRNVLANGGATLVHHGETVDVDGARAHPDVVRGDRLRAPRTADAPHLPRDRRPPPTARRDGRDGSRGLRPAA